jgi:hypothetical protein
MFVFRTAADAAQFVRSGASPRCRRRAVAYRVGQPAGARALVWTNPDGAQEADVFFSRGARAYRLVDVLPPTYLQGQFRFDAAEMIALPQALACRLGQARCARPSPRPALSPPGYDALKILDAGASRVGRLPEFEAREVLDRACVTLSGFSDPEARLFYESCQVTLHFLADADYSRRCERGGPCRQWAIGTAAADLQRVAAIERGLAGRLTPGACRTAWAREAASSDQLGQAFLLYDRALAARDLSARRAERNRAGQLSRESQRHMVAPLEVLVSCAPRGASATLPETA